jgi:hypothetical protein
MLIFAVAEWVPIVSLVMSCLGIPTLAALIVTDLYKRHKENSAKAKEDRLKESQESIRAVVSEELKDIKNDINGLKADFELTKQSLQATLRHELYEISDKWLTKGYCPIQDKEDFENIYKKYHALGKNGVMDDLYAKVMSLPTSKPRQKKRVTHA